jgi:hypothetical protein
VALIQAAGTSAGLATVAGAGLAKSEVEAAAAGVAAVVGAGASVVQASGTAAGIATAEARGSSGQYAYPERRLTGESRNERRIVGARRGVTIIGRAA